MHIHKFILIIILFNSCFIKNNIMKKKFSTNGAYFIVSKTISLNRCRTGTFCYASILNEKDNPVPILLDSDFESTLNITNNYCSTFYKKKTGFVLTIPIHKRYLNKKKYANSSLQQKLVKSTNN